MHNREEKKVKSLEKENEHIWQYNNSMGTLSCIYIIQVHKWIKDMMITSHKACKHAKWGPWESMVLK